MPNTVRITRFERKGLRSFLLLAIIIFITATSFCKCAAQQKTEQFIGWDDLKNDVPEWFRDAKFGIYFHWGVYSVPAFNSEWYSRSMYVPGTGPNKHQLATYGSLKDFGYKDFIPMFKAEHFNADEWADLFVKAGARFAGPVAEHADGFSMWDSEVNPWNAVKMGPHQDIVGKMEIAIRKRNLKFITTFHHQWQWGWYPTFDSSTDAGNPAYAGLYGPVVSVAAWNQKDSAERPDQAFTAHWLAKVKEVINKYQPDLLYFDSRLGHIDQEYRRDVVTTYFDKGSKEKRVILYKAKDLPENVGVRTYEKLRMNRMGDRTWLSEEPISTYSWCYTEDMVLRPAQDILHSLIDIVSKNGVYLLNICPKADGTIPQEQKDILLAIGDWLAKYGESVYGSRPWYTYGEGPQKDSDEKNEIRDKRLFAALKYSADDIRYTTRGSTIYAIILGFTEKDKTIVLRSFNTTSLPGKIKIKRITLLGSNKKVKWDYADEGLSIRPLVSSRNMAAVYKIETALK